MGLSVLTCQASIAEELSFSQALERMYQVNEKIKASDSEVEQSQYARKAARGLYFPKVWVDSKHTWIDEDIVIDLNDIRTVIGTLHGINPAILPSFVSTVQDTEFSNVTASFSWVLFSGGKITAANRAADAVVIERQEERLYTRSVLITELAKRYYGTIVSAEAVKVHKQVMDGIDKHLHQARKLEERGLLARAERLHAAVAYEDAQRQYKKAVRETNIVQAGLKNTLAAQEQITPASPLFLTRQIAPLETWQDLARQNNHLLKKVAAQKDQALQKCRVEESAHLPDIYLFGQYEVDDTDLTLLEPEWAMGIGLKMSLFEGFSTTNKIRAARKQEEAVGHLASKAEQDILTLVEKKYHELMMEIDQFDALNASMAFATENLRVHSRAFNAGMATSLSVVDAQLALSRAKIEKLNAVYQFDVALAELLEVCGMSESYETYQHYNDVEVLF